LRRYRRCAVLPRRPALVRYDCQKLHSAMRRRYGAPARVAAAPMVRRRFAFMRLYGAAVSMRPPSATIPPWRGGVEFFRQLKDRYSIQRHREARVDPVLQKRWEGRGVWCGV